MGSNFVEQGFESGNHQRHIPDFGIFLDTKTLFAHTLCEYF